MQDPFHFEQGKQANNLVSGSKVVDDARILTRRGTAVALDKCLPLESKQNALLGSQGRLVLDSGDSDRSEQVDHVELVVEFLLAIANKPPRVCFFLRSATPAKVKGAQPDPLHDVGKCVDVREGLSSVPNVDHDLVCVGLLDQVAF